MTNKLEMMLQAGCTAQEVKKVERYLGERKAGKTPCPDLRRNNLRCNGRLEVYLQKLSKEAANCPHKRQEQKEATVWAVETARALARGCAHLPEGWITLDQIVHEELAAVYISGIDGKFPALDTCDNAAQRKVYPFKEELKEFYGDVAMPITFDAPSYMEDLRDVMGNLWTKSNNAADWAAGHASIQPVAVEVSWVRDNQIRREVRTEIENIVRTFPSMR